MKHRIVVAIEVFVDPEVANCPVNGVSAIAENFAQMALCYGSIGAEFAEVLTIEAVSKNRDIR